MSTALVVDFENQGKSALEIIDEIAKLLRKLYNDNDIRGYGIALLLSKDVDVEVLEAET